MAAKHQYEDEINKRRVEIIESINDIPTALKERDYIRVRILLNRSKELLEKIVDIASIPDFKTAAKVTMSFMPLEGDSGSSIVEPIKNGPIKRSARPRKPARDEDLGIPYIPE